MTVERSPYYPELIDRTLREWEKWTSLAEGISSSLPDAHRHPEGGIPDKRRAADRVADVEKAFRVCVPVGSLEWRTVCGVQEGSSLSSMADLFRIRKSDVLKAYQVAIRAMACYLGWEEPREGETE